MRTWILVSVFVYFDICLSIDITTTDGDFLTTLLPETTVLSKNEPVFIPEQSTTALPATLDNKTLEETQKRLQRIANITIAQFLNNHTRRNLSLAEILELRDLGNLVMNPNFMLPSMVGKSNKTEISKVILPSTLMMNFGSAVLKSNFMPPALFKPLDPPPIKTDPVAEEEMGNVTQSTVQNATIDEALSTMTFHRTMMHEFLCRNYIAEGILQMLEKDAAILGDNEDDESLSKRQGEDMTPDMGETLAEMFTDLGSSRYKDWLARSAVMTDVYRNMGGFEPVPYVVKYKPSAETPVEHREDKVHEESEEEDDEEEKEVRKKPTKKKKKKKKKKKPTPKPEEEEEEDDAVEDEEEMEDEDEEDNDGEAGTVLQVIDSHLLHHPPQYDTVDSGWSIFKFGFVDFYDSALTAIAFMTFGIYTLQVFINLITNSSQPKMGILVNNSTSAPPVVANKRRSLDLLHLGIINATETLPASIDPQENATTPLPPTTQTESQIEKNNKEKEKLKEDMHNFTTHVISLVDAVKEGFSLKPTFEFVKVDELIPNVELFPDPEPEPTQHERPPYVSPEEVVAKFALVTLRAVLKMDEPRCLHAALCRANRATLHLEGPPRLWLPMWSVGMSWLAQRAGGIPGSQELVAGALENLKASVLGLAGVKCEVVYPSC